MNDSIRTAEEIRRAYIEFFEERGHTVVPSAPLVPRGDPTLLFTSAGMVQFKDFYLSPENLPYTRAVSVQKCLRAGDLESVGRTLRHHTFFEMLGNFSFGDYFKEEAIDWAWEFVTGVLELPEERLYISIFEDDDDASGIWKRRTGFADDRIVRLGRDDNFWGPVGATGVCGPCSEIYYDMGEGAGCGSPDCAPGCDCDRYLEFWNLVFPQFFLDEGGMCRDLDKPGIDTGAGLERIAVIMQGAPDNFHTDIFKPLVDAVAGRLPGGSPLDGEAALGVNMIADHVRALTFTIAEGIYPSNEGRGYLLRRILRRALTRLHSFGIEEPVLFELVDTVTDVMGGAYPELVERAPDTSMIVRSEEESFFRTLEEGKSRFGAIVGEVKEEGGSRIDGDRVFVLYDTYGLPPELTAELAAGEGLDIDREGFERAMAEQRRRAKEKSSFESGGAEIVEMTTVSEGESSIFTGYESVGGRSRIRSFRPIDKRDREDVEWSSPEGRGVELIFERTPFYAASGGQVADRGRIEIGGEIFEIRDVFKRGGEIVHLAEHPGGKVELEELVSKDPVAELRLDDSARLATAANHTVTHLLHAALRRVVGSHVAQAGSLVDAGKLRFDFNHFEQLSVDQIRGIESKVNGWIRDALPVRTELMDYSKALESGAIALFDEKYGARVRVVRISDVSTELCGGTHLSSTGQAGLFLVLSESSVAAGVRRIEAVTGEAALRRVFEMEDREREAAGLLRAIPAEIPSRLRSLLESVSDLEKEIDRLEKGGAGAGLDVLIRSAGDIEGVKVVSGRIEARDMGALRNQADMFRSKVDSGVAVLSAPLKGKMHYIVTVTDDLVARGVTADSLVGQLGPVAGGGGGGRKHLAQLGTREKGSEKKVFEALPGILNDMIRQRG